MATVLNREVMNDAMVEAFKSHFRGALKEQLLKVAEPLIEASIADAMKTFDVAIQTYWTPERFGETVELILKDRRGNERSNR